MTDVKVLKDGFWSDRYPVVISCNLNYICPKVDMTSNFVSNSVFWGMRDISECEIYIELCDNLVRDLYITMACICCVMVLIAKRLVMKLLYVHCIVK